MGIRAALIIAFLLSSIAVLLSCLLLVNWSFGHNAQSVIEERISSDFQQSIIQLADNYAIDGEWAGWTNKHYRLMTLLKSSAENRARYGLGANKGNEQFGPPRGFKPPPRAEHGGNRKPFDRPPPNGRRAPPPHHPKNGFGLLNANGDDIISSGSKWPVYSLAITLAGDVVGYLNVPKTGTALSDIEATLLARQWDLLPYIGLLLLLLSSLMAWWLGRWFAKPIEALSLQAQQWAAGNYQSATVINRKDELGRLAKDLNHLGHVLKNNESQRKKWLADISHELRTPITVLKGEIEALIDGVRPLNKQAIESLETDTSHLQALVEDLYQLAEAELGGMRYQFAETHCSEVVTDAVNRHRRLCEEQQLQLTLSVDGGQCLVEADEHRLYQLLDNLLTNSCKYTNKNGQIQVKVTQRTNAVEIIIEDSAPGVSSEEINHLFDHLFRAEFSRSRQFGGAGLGLSICQQIVAAHKGIMVAGHSSLGGVKITVTLPKALYG